jgi:hypothetical protein
VAVQDRADLITAAAGRERSVAPATAAVFGCLLRAVALTCMAGYTLGQVVHRHSGPPLIDFLSGAGGLAVLLILAALTWLELAVLQTWPRVGLSVSASWCVAITAVGCYAAATDAAVWLVPAAVFAVPALLSVLRPSAWRAPARPWRRPAVVRTVEMTFVHGVGANLLVVIWTGPITSAPVLGGVTLGVVLTGWLLAVLGQLPGSRRRQAAGLLVAPDVAVLVALTLFVSATVG